MTIVISRRSMLVGLATLALPWKAQAEELSVDSAEGPIKVTRFAAADSAPRPAVLILHGSGGTELNPKVYTDHAEAIAGIGIDAYLVYYYTAADHSFLSDKAHTVRDHRAYNLGRFAAWATRTSDAVAFVKGKAGSSGRVGLLGVSLGGYIAAEAAAQDDRISALVIFYAGMPPGLRGNVRHMPPLLAFHGDADRLVPLSEGRTLVQLAQNAGAQADLVVYPGKRHGFDFKENDPDALDAMNRTKAFLTKTLL
ncbi:MAG: dienelactone hydrolase family protein [Rhizobiaceae bacterium]|nr:dienelactone hydrolase family protein [Rhizobiaceae bacterium]